MSFKIKFIFSPERTCTLYTWLATLVIFVWIPCQYLIQTHIWNDSCAEQELTVPREMRSRNFRYRAGNNGLSKDLFHLFPHAVVNKRNSKFEALFRDHLSLNKVPEGLHSKDTLFQTNPNETYKPWEKFYRDINRYQLYSYNNSEMMTSLLTYLYEAPIIICKQMPGGTQIKLNITFQDGGRSLMKPWRVPREYVTIPDHYFFADIERHTSEIAAFHVDRILDFRRVPPTIGRIYNITSEIQPHAEGKVFVKSFHKSPECRQYCEASQTPVCGKPDRVEGSSQAYLPFEYHEGRRRTWINPFKRPYKMEPGGEAWENDPSYCHRVVMKTHPYDKGRRLLDIIDLAIFDFLIDNFDRHNYNTFSRFGDFSTTVHYDHGRAFGRHKQDDMVGLAALQLCCILRNSTYQRLLILDKDEYKLGDVMRESLSLDPIAPILDEPHFGALNRRLGIVLAEIKKCIDSSDSESDVLKPEPTLQEYLRSKKGL